MSKTTKSSRLLSDIQFREKHVRNYRKSKLSQAQYCRENKLKLSTFRYWEKRIHQDKVQVAASNADSVCKSDFIDVTHILATKNSAPTNTFLEIEIGQDYKIKVPPNWEAENLRKILALLKEVACSSI